MFYNAVLTRNYEEAYNFLYALENVSTNEYLRKEYKVYLYLLSQVSQVPEIYKTKIEDINSDPLLMLHRKPNNLQKQEDKKDKKDIKDNILLAILSCEKCRAMSVLRSLGIDIASLIDNLAQVFAQVEISACAFFLHLDEGLVGFHTCLCQF